MCDIILLMNRTSKRMLLQEIRRSLKGYPGHAGTVAVFASFAAFVYFKNRLTPRYADDYPYSFIWDGDNNGNLLYGNQKYRRVKSFKDLLRSQISHYKTWGGRTLAHSLAQAFLAFDDKKHFDRANTLAILTQLFICASLGSGKIADLRSVSPEKALLLTAGFFFSAPHIFASCFWLTGAMNYLWMGILQSAFVLPYSLKYHGTLQKFPESLAFLSGLLSGWSSEAGAGAAMMLAGMETLFSLIHKEYSSWMGFGLLGGFIGMLLLLLSPGNRTRYALTPELEECEPDSPEDHAVSTKEFLYSPAMFKKWFKEGFLYTLYKELPLQIPVILYFLQEKCRDRKTDLFILALESAVLAVPSVMMLSPEYPQRATYSSVLYLLSAAVRVFDHLDIPDFNSLNPLQKSIALAAAFYLSVKALSGLIVDADNSVQFDRQIKFIKNNRHDPIVYVEDTDIPSPYIFLAGDRSITADACMGICNEYEENYYNKAVSAYYGAHKVKCGPYDEHVYEQNDPSSILFSITNPVKSLVMKTKEIIRGSKEYDPIDTVFYPLKKCGHPGTEYYVYDKPLKGNKKPIVYSLGARSGSAAGLSRLEKITEKLGHDHIDLLKLHISGSVSDVLRSLKESNVPIRQICLEIHGIFFYKNREKFKHVVDEMHKMGYIVIYWDKKISRFTFLKRANPRHL